MNSDDIKNAYQGNSENLANCRFIMDCVVPENENIYLEIVSGSGEIYGRVTLTNTGGVTEGQIRYGEENITVTYGFDTDPFIEVHDASESFAHKRVEIANGIGVIYQKMGVVLFGLFNIGLRLYLQEVNLFDTHQRI